MGEEDMRELKDLLRSRMAAEDAERRELLRATTAQYHDLKSVLMRVGDQVLAVDQRVQQHELDDERRIGAVIVTQTAQGTRMQALEDAQETTGVHNREQLVKSAETHADDAKFFKRWLIGLVGALFVAVLSIGIQVLLKR